MSSQFANSSFDKGGTVWGDMVLHDTSSPSCDDDDDGSDDDGSDDDDARASRCDCNMNMIIQKQKINSMRSYPIYQIRSKLSLNPIHNHPHLSPVNAKTKKKQLAKSNFSLPLFRGGSRVPIPFVPYHSPFPPVL